MTEAPIEVELDSRQRLPLARIVKGEHGRYRVDVFPDGEIHLTPVISVSARELLVLRNAETMAMIDTGLEDVRAGRVAPFNLDAYEAEVNALPEDKGEQPV